MSGKNLATAQSSTTALPGSTTTVDTTTLPCGKKKAKPKVIYLQLKFQDPAGTARPFPKTFPVDFVFTGGTTGVTTRKAVGDAQGNVKCEVPTGQTKFTLKFDSAKVRYLVVDGTSVSLKADLSDKQLCETTRHGKPFFALPTTWSLVHSKWDATVVTVPKDGGIAIGGGDVAASGAPGVLTLRPVYQYVRFEFFDRKYGKASHGNKRVSIPPVPLKGARTVDASGLPVAPAAGTHDAISSFVVDAGDPAKACQALAWVKTRTDVGDDLPALKKDMLLEFGWENGYVQSTSATERKVVKLPPDSSKLKPTKDRRQYYDLPVSWRSHFQYTRLSGGTGKLFDELADQDVADSLGKAKPLTFSLDDIVLVAGGSQDVKDMDASDAEIDRSKHSRVAILRLDPDHAYDVAVWNPRADAAYHSDVTFLKEAGSDVHRNLLVDCALDARAIVFCNGVYDVHDKRTTAATFADKEILGARAARLADTDVSSPRQVFDQASHVTTGLVHRTRVFHLYYLHYGATDGTAVYGVLLTLYTLRFVDQAGVPFVNGPWKGKPVTTDPAHLRLFRDDGLRLSMERWNGKGYEVEPRDDKRELVVKPFYLFEAKDVEDPQGTFNEVGGSHLCCCAVGADDSEGSAATDTDMFMRLSGHREEGARWGSMPGPPPHPGEARETDYDGSEGAPRCAFAHELGHAAVGLWDDYIVTKVKKTAVPSYVDVQRYPGVPFHHDKASMMSVNQAVRLRSLWGRILWLNRQSKSGGSLNGFLGGKVFQGTYEPAGKAKLKYFLSSDAAFYAPAKQEAAVAFENEGQADLQLYELGDDEFARWMKNGPYDGMLNVDWKISVVFVSGLSPAPAAWATGTAYALGACVDYQGKKYACATAHTAAAAFADDAASWIEIKGRNDHVNWAAGGTIDPDTWYINAGKGYVTASSHTAGTRTTLHWGAPGADRGAWSTGADYATGDVVDAGGTPYVCTADHTAGPAIDPASFTPIAPWASGAAYAVGDLCTDGGAALACSQAHTAGSCAADVEDGRLVKPASIPVDWPSESSKRDWITTFDNDLHDSVEGDGGRLKLTSAKSKQFTKIYVRAFPQWCIKAALADADQADTQFTYVVEYTNDATFWTNASELNLGRKPNKNTVSRYMLGRLSDDPDARANEDTTGDLAPADIGKIKEWVDGQTGDAKTADTIEPVVSAVAPPGGAAVGATVTITGTNLTGATAVKFGAATQATLASVSATRITVVVPAGASKAKVEVTTPNGKGVSKAAFKILPAITAVSPTTPVAVNATVTITGTTLGGATAVKFGTVAQPVFTATPTRITAAVPATATTGKVAVTTPDGTATSAGNVTIVPPPTVSGFNPTSAKVGDSVTIAGTNLGRATSVTIGGVAATIRTNTETQIVARVGAGAASGSVVVTTAGGTVTTAGYVLTT